MFGIFGDSVERLFIKEMKERGVKIAKPAVKDIVAIATNSVDVKHRGLPGDYGHNLGEDAILHYAGWTAAIVNRAAGRPARTSAIDPDMGPESDAAIRAVLVKHGVLQG